ncbi:hypothetical protein MICRO8M_100354 [Microbacterium sp. 8M]|nr:hypothetical protein MICRO8M_100354 [Microbacterium sp. 8M]
MRGLGERDQQCPVELFTADPGVMGVLVGEHDREEARLADEAHRLERPPLGTSELEPVQPQDHRLRRSGFVRCGRDDLVVLIHAAGVELRFVLLSRGGLRRAPTVPQQHEVTGLVVPQRCGRLHPTGYLADQVGAGRPRGILCDHSVRRDVQVPHGGADQLERARLALGLLAALCIDQAAHSHGAQPSPELTRSAVERRVVGETRKRGEVAVVEMDLELALGRHDRVEVKCADQQADLTLGETVQRRVVELEERGQIVDSMIGHSQKTPGGTKRGQTTTAILAVRSRRILSAPSGAGQAVPAPPRGGFPAPSFYDG